MMKTLRFCFALLLVAAILTPSEASAQTVIGAKAGLSLANVTFSGDGVSASPDGRTGFVGGAFAQFGIGSPWFIQPEVLYSSKGFEVDSDALSLGYVEIPVLFGAAFPLSNSALKPMVFAGPSVAFKLSCDADGYDCGDDVKSVDFGIVFGAGIQYDLESISLFLDGRYDLGLTDIGDISELSSADVSIKNRAWQFMVGAGFPVGG
jgi:hypothetical protein